MSKIHIFGIKCWYLNSTVIATQLDNQGKKYYPILRYFLSDRSTKKDKINPSDKTPNSELADWWGIISKSTLQRTFLGSHFLTTPKSRNIKVIERKK